MIGRFAPSPTGDAHPGTMLAALLAWLDARSQGGKVILRLEDLDVERVRDGFAQRIRDAMQWIGLTDWDATHTQSDFHARHAAALDQLQAAGHLYACSCSRATLKAHGVRAPDGGFAYPNSCRACPLPQTGWRTPGVNIRVRLPDERIELIDESGLDLSQTPSVEMGDPIVVRRDGAVAYQLAVVVDDAAVGVTRVIRGRDIAPSTATQVALQRLLGLPTPAYRHHFLLLEPRGDKLAKLHGSIGATALREAMTGEEMCTWLAQTAGLGHATKPEQLITTFNWANVPTNDVTVRYDGQALNAE